MSNFKTKVGALLITASLAGAGASLGVPAYAQNTGAEATPAAVTNPAAVNASKDVSLTINKYEGEVGDTSKPLGGISFTLKRIDADLTTNDGWDKVAAAAKELEDGKTPATTGDAIKAETGGNGTVTVGKDQGVTVGAYLVEEVQKGSYSVAKPFIVTLPYNTAEGWKYEQTVNPKNQNTKPDKQVDDSKAGISQDLTYTINAPVPAGDLTRLNIKDELVQQLTLKTDSLEVTTNADGVSLTKDTDYTVTATERGFTVSFTKDGLKKLQDARANKPDLKVSVKFDATINSLPADGGAIINTAKVEYPNGAEVDTDVDPTNPSDPKQPTKTTFANLELTKTGSVAGSLAGAEFDVFQCFEEDGKWKASGDPVTFVGTDGNTDKVVTTDDNAEDTSSNVYTAKGLIRSSFSGGNTGEKTNDYCVLETKAPEGFIANPEIVHATWVEATGDQPGKFTVSVENKKDTWSNRLPATGAMGIVLIFLVGLALLARGLYTSYRDRGATA